MLRRINNSEDPWLSLVDHGTATTTNQILYGEASYGNPHASILSAHDGADVYIRA